jgi:hypothetical protein
MKKATGLGRGLSALIDDSARIRTDIPTTSDGGVRPLKLPGSGPIPRNPGSYLTTRRWPSWQPRLPSAVCSSRSWFGP